MGFFKRNSDEEGIESITGTRIVPAPEVEEETVELSFDRVLVDESLYEDDVELANQLAKATPAQLAGEAIVWLATAENDEDGESAAIATAYLTMARYVQDFGNVPQNPSAQ